MGTTTISGNVFDVYSETADPIADSKSYMLGKIGAEAWTDDAEKIDKQQALITATRWIRRFLTAQLVDPAAVPDPNVTPAPLLVAQATYETAFALVVKPTVQNLATTETNVKRAKGGSAVVEFFKPTGGTAFPQIANALLFEFLNEIGGTSDAGAAVFGTDGESEFCDQNKFGRSRGFT